MLKKLITLITQPTPNKDEINGFLVLSFKGKTLEQSIAINQRYNELFKSELNQRHIKASNDLELIENYFNPKRKQIYKIDVNDPVFEEPIKN